MDKKNFKAVHIPDAPGVYFFLGVKKEILYIGKATSLQSRVSSYFSKDIAEKRSKLIEQMVTEAKNVEYTQTDSVLEALILESNLIRTHKPKYNTISKDDKSYNHLIITKETFPRVLVVRGKDLIDKYPESEIKYHFGPFTNATLFKEALKIVRKLFKFYDTARPVGAQKGKMEKGKIDFNVQIGLYPEQVSTTEYTKTIRHIRLFFEGKKKIIIKELEKDMMQCAKQEAFEEAHILKKKIFALQHIQDVALLTNDMRSHKDEHTVRIEAYDVAHLQGENMVGVMTVVEGSEIKKHEYRLFNITTVNRSNDTAALKEMLERRLEHKEWVYPEIIVVDGSTAQKNVAQKVLKEFGLVIPVVAVVKDEHHKPIRLIAAQKLLERHQNAILLANAESHRFAISFHRDKQRKSALR